MTDERSDREPTADGVAPTASIRIVFFGTPMFAVPTLRHLAGDDRFDVRLVVTQPDRPAGRGRRLEASPVKAAADALGLTVYQPRSLRTPDDREPLVTADADLFVVAAHGLVFGPKTLAIPRRGCVNLHASLLPRYRGASPIVAAILSGDSVSGLTAMVMEPGLDTGPMLGHLETPVGGEDTTASLGERLASQGPPFVAELLPPFVAGDLSPTPQPATEASLTRPLTKTDGWLRWAQPAATLERQVRAMWPWPRAWTLLDGQPLQVFAAEVAPPPPEEPGLAPGTLVDVGGEPAVVCGGGLLILRRVQPAGGKAMDGRAFLAGRRYALTQVLGEGAEPPAQPPLVVSVGGQAAAETG